MLHPHTTGMKGKALRLNGFARSKDRRDFSFHRGVR
jgi:hypothetical protein